MRTIILKDLLPSDRKAADLCVSVRQNAYAPYSGFKVGAAAVSKNGKIFAGCNVESADYSLTTHAEMNAIDTMVSWRAQAGQNICGPVRRERPTRALRVMQAENAGIRSIA
jgi:cytidine deaminase